MAPTIEASNPNGGKPPSKLYREVEALHHVQRFNDKILEQEAKRHAEEQRRKLQEEANLRRKEAKEKRQRAVEAELRRLIREEEAEEERRKVEEQKRMIEEEQREADLRMKRRQEEELVEKRAREEYEQRKRKEAMELKQKMYQEKLGKFQFIKESSTAPMRPPRRKQNGGISDLVKMRYEQQAEVVKMQERMAQERFQQTQSKKHAGVSNSFVKRSLNNLLKKKNAKETEKIDSKRTHFKEDTLVAIKRPSLKKGHSKDSIGHHRGSHGSVSKQSRTHSCHRIPSGPEEMGPTKNEMQNYLLSSLLFDENNEYFTWQKKDTSMNDVREKETKEIERRQRQFESYKQDMETLFKFIGYIKGDKEHQQKSRQESKLKQKSVVPIDSIKRKFEDKGEGHWQNTPKTVAVQKLDVEAKFPVAQKSSSEAHKSTSYTPVIIDQEAFARTMSKFEQYSQEEKMREQRMEEMRQRALNKAKAADKNTKIEAKDTIEEMEVDQGDRMTEKDFKAKVREELDEIARREQDYRAKCEEENRKRALICKIREEIYKIRNKESTQEDECPRWVQMVKEAEAKFGPFNKEGKSVDKGHIQSPQDVEAEVYPKDHHNERTLEESVTEIMALISEYDPAEKSSLKPMKFSHDSGKINIMKARFMNQDFPEDQLKEANKISNEPNRSSIEISKQRLMRSFSYNEPNTASKKPSSYMGRKCSEIRQKFSSTKPNEVKTKAVETEINKKKIVPRQSIFFQNQDHYNVKPKDKSTQRNWSYQNKSLITSNTLSDQAKHTNLVSSQPQVRQQSHYQTEQSYLSEQSILDKDINMNDLKSNDDAKLQNNMDLYLQLLEDTKPKKHAVKNSSTNKQIILPLVNARKNRIMSSFKDENGNLEQRRETVPVGKLDKSKLKLLESSESKERESSQNQVSNGILESMKKKYERQQKTSTEPKRLKNFNPKKIIYVGENVESEHKTEQSNQTPRKIWKWKEKLMHDLNNTDVYRKELQSEPEHGSVTHKREQHEENKVECAEFDPRTLEIQRKLDQRDQEFSHLLSELDKVLHKCNLDNANFEVIKEQVRERVGGGESTQTFNSCTDKFDGIEREDEEKICNSVRKFRERFNQLDAVPCKPRTQSAIDPASKTQKKNWFNKRNQRGKEESFSKSKSCSNMTSFWESKLNKGAKKEIEITKPTERPVVKTGRVSQIKSSLDDEQLERVNLVRQFFNKGQPNKDRLWQGDVSRDVSRSNVPPNLKTGRVDMVVNELTSKNKEKSAVYNEPIKRSKSSIALTEMQSDTTQRTLNFSQNCLGNKQSNHVESIKRQLFDPKQDQSNDKTLTHNNGPVIHQSFIQQVNNVIDMIEKGTISDEAADKKLREIETDIKNNYVQKMTAHFEVSKPFAVSREKKFISNNQCEFHSGRGGIAQKKELLEQKLLRDGNEDICSAPIRHIQKSSSCSDAFWSQSAEESSYREPVKQKLLPSGQSGYVHKLKDKLEHSSSYKDIRESLCSPELQSKTNCVQKVQNSLFFDKGMSENDSEARHFPASSLNKRIVEKFDCSSSTKPKRYEKNVIRKSHSLQKCKSLSEIQSKLLDQLHDHPQSSHVIPDIKTGTVDQLKSQLFSPQDHSIATSAEENKTLKKSQSHSHIQTLQNLITQHRNVDEEPQNPVQNSIQTGICSAAKEAILRNSLSSSKDLNKLYSCPMAKSCSVSNLANQFESGSLNNTAIGNREQIFKEGPHNLSKIIDLLNQRQSEDKCKDSMEKQQIQAELDYLREHRDDINFEALESQRLHSQQRLQLQDELQELKRAQSIHNIQDKLLNEFSNCSNKEKLKIVTELNALREIRRNSFGNLKTIQHALLFGNNRDVQAKLDAKETELKSDLQMLKEQRAKWELKECGPSSYQKEFDQRYEELEKFWNKPLDYSFFFANSNVDERNKSKEEVADELWNLRGQRKLDHSFFWKSSSKSTGEKEERMREIDELKGKISLDHSIFAKSDHVTNTEASERLSELEQLRRNLQIDHSIFSKSNASQGNERTDRLEELSVLRKGKPLDHTFFSQSNKACGNQETRRELEELKKVKKKEYGSEDQTESQYETERQRLLGELDAVRRARALLGKDITQNNPRSSWKSREEINSELDMLRQKKHPLFGEIGGALNSNVQRSAIDEELAALRRHSIADLQHSISTHNHQWSQERAYIWQELEVLRSGKLKAFASADNLSNSQENEKLKVQTELDMIRNLRRSGSLQFNSFSSSSESINMEKHQRQMELQAVRDIRKRSALSRIHHGDQDENKRHKNSGARRGARVDLDHGTLEELRSSNAAVKAMFESSAPRYKFGQKLSMTNDGQQSRPKPRKTLPRKQKEERKWVMETINKYFEVIEEEDEENNRDDADENKEIIYPDTDEEDNSDNEDNVGHPYHLQTFKSTPDIRNMFSNVVQKVSSKVGASREELVGDFKQKLISQKSLNEDDCDEEEDEHFYECEN